jgi:formylglycine-generating enzyme
MQTTLSKSLVSLLSVCVAFWLMATYLIADEARFFRVAGPTAVTITAFTQSGYITWTNAQPGINYTIQTARRLTGPSNWVDYIQVPVSNTTVTHRLYDPHPPSEMAFIPAGSFTMGNCMDTNEGNAYELPLHTVYVSAFYIDRCKVTKALWDEVKVWSAGNGYSYVNPGSGKASTHPVQRINWYDCVKWCNARSQKEGLTPCYYNESGLTSVYTNGQVTPYVKWTADGYRLPTEAEWEKAARGGASGHRFPWSDTDSIAHGQANYYSDSHYAYDISLTRNWHPAFLVGAMPYTSPVGYFLANGYGLYDMAGNVWEWCWDWYGIAWYSDAGARQNDTRGPASGTERVMRGGSFYDSAVCARCAERFFRSPGNSWDYYVGFRCARGV